MLPIVVVPRVATLVTLLAPAIACSANRTESVQPLPVASKTATSGGASRMDTGTVAKMAAEHVTDKPPYATLPKWYSFYDQFGIGQGWLSGSRLAQ